VFLVMCWRSADTGWVVGGGQRVAYGTSNGVYFQELREPVKVLSLTDVSQVEILDEYGVLIVLSGWSYTAIDNHLVLTFFSDFQ